MKKEEFISKLRDNKNALEGAIYLYSIYRRYKELGECEKKYGCEGIEKKAYEKELKKYAKSSNALLDKTIVEEIEKQKTYYPDIYLNSLFSGDGLKIKYIEVDEKTLTNTIIEELENVKIKQNINNYDEKKYLVSDLAQGLVKDLLEIYAPYYEEQPPMCVMCDKVPKTTIRVKKGINLWKLEEEKGVMLKYLIENMIKKDGTDDFECYKNVKEDIDFDEIAKEIKEIKKQKKYSLYNKFTFPIFNMAMATGNEGLFYPLTEWIEKNKKEDRRISNINELELFLNEYIPYFLVNMGETLGLFKEEGNNVDISSEDRDEINDIAKNLLNVIFIDQYEKGMMTKIKFSFSKENKFPNALETKKEMSDSENGRIKETKTLFMQIKEYTGDSSNLPYMCVDNGTKVRIVYFSNQKKWDLYNQVPMWAYKIVDSLRKNGGTSWSKVPLGKSEITEKQVSVNFTGQQDWWISLMAGSGSGKGVSTMAILGQAISKGYPFMYLDCKPDMASTIANWGEEHKDLTGGINKAVCIDGLNNDDAMFRRYTSDGKVKLELMKEKVRQRIGEKDTNGIVKDICNMIMWTRAVELFLGIMYVRGKYLDDKASEFYKKKVDNSELIKGEDRELLKEIGRADIYPLFIMDELQAESLQIAGLIEQSDREIVNIVKDGDKKDKEGQQIYKEEKIKEQGKMINYMKKHGEYANYINNVMSWVKEVFGGGDGIIGNVMTAFGRQCQCNIFTISQNVPEFRAKDDTYYGLTLGNMLRAYLGKYMKLYGKGSNVGQGTFSLNKAIKSLVDDKDMRNKIGGQLERGEFVFVGDVSGKGSGNIERIKTYLTIDDAYTIVDGNPKPNDRLLNVIPKGNDKVKNEVIDEKGNVRDKRVSTLDYIADIDRSGMDNIFKNIGYSYDYFNKFTKFLYGCEFWDKIYDCDTFILSNPSVIYKAKVEGVELKKNEFREEAIKIFMNEIEENEDELYTRYMEEYNNEENTIIKKEVVEEE